MRGSTEERSNVMFRAAGAAALFAAITLSVTAKGQLPPLPSAATGGADQTIRTFDSAGKQTLNFLAHEGRVAALIYFPDGRRIISAGDKTVKFWNSDDGSLENSLDAHDKEVLCIALSPDGRILASGGADNLVKLWNPFTGKLLKTIPAHTQAVRAIAWSPDNSLFASSGSDRLIQLWRADGTLAGTIIAHDEPVISLAWTRDGKLILGGTSDGWLKAWKLSDLGTAFTRHAHEKAVTGIAVQRMGDLIATCSSDGKVKIWTPGEKTFIEGAVGLGEKGMNCLSWSMDGKLLLAAGGDKVLHYWVAPDLKELTKVPAHDSAVTALAVAPVVAR